MKTVVFPGLFALVVFVSGVVSHPTTNCTAEYMDNLLRQVQHIREQCDLKERYDCCKALTLSKHVLLHTPQSGMYETTNPCAHIDERSYLMQTRCDMETDGGGWTVILRRQRYVPGTNFRRGWDDYEIGFGNPKFEYWIGLKNIHCLTQRDNVELRIDTHQIDGNVRTWIFNRFKVAGSNDYYRIDIGESTGPSDGYDAMAYLNGSQFSTQDSDHDRSSINCVQDSSHGGGWWHSNCHGVQSHPIGVHWYKGAGTMTAHSPSYFGYFIHAEMKIRPKSCISECR